MIRILALLILFAASAQAQAPPSQAELAAYRGLHRAAADGDVAAIERLRDDNADPNARDSLGRTPLHVAAWFGKPDVIATLVRRGADPQLYDAGHVDALTIAATQGNRAAVSLLLWLGADPGAVTGRDDRTALIAAAREGHADVVRELALAGANLNWVSSLGWTALMEAVIFGTEASRTAETVRALLDAGAKARFTDWQGTTVLRLARQRGYDDVAALLVAAGAN